MNVTAKSMDIIIGWRERERIHSYQIYIKQNKLAWHTPHCSLEVIVEKDINLPIIDKWPSMDINTYFDLFSQFMHLCK